MGFWTPKNNKKHVFLLVPKRRLRYPYPHGLAGPEIVDFWGLNAPSYWKTHWKTWGAKPPPFSKGFPVGGGRLDPPKTDAFSTELLKSKN